MEKANRIRIYSYSKVWNTESRIYAIHSVVLPVPVKPRELLYFFIVAVVVLILSSIIPFFSVIPVVVRFLAIPYLAMKFLVKKKLDGKAPQKYFIGYIKHAVTSKMYAERFKMRSGKMKDTIKVNWLCGMREKRLETVKKRRFKW